MNYLHSHSADTILFCYVHFERLATDYERLINDGIGRSIFHTKHFVKAVIIVQHRCNFDSQVGYGTMALNHCVYHGQYIEHASKTRHKIRLKIMNSSDEKIKAILAKLLYIRGHNDML